MGSDAKLNPFQSLRKVFNRSQSETEPTERRRKTFVRQSSQHKFKDRDQTAIVFDFDDTLFPTTFFEKESGLDGSLEDLETHMMDEYQDALEKMEECQASAEMLLQCVPNHGHVFIVTLSTRGLLQKRCEAWYPRVWKLLNDSNITIISAMEAHRASLKKGQKTDNSTFSSGYWAWVKGRAIAQELDRFYSQYEGQTWKNVISIGDSVFEQYGTLGAASAHVENKIRHSNTAEGDAFAQAWQRFDNNPDWSEALEGVHNGRIFKVRTKTVKMMDNPSPCDLAEQLTLILDCFPDLVCLDSCFSHRFDDLSEATTASFKSALADVNDD